MGNLNSTTIYLLELENGKYYIGKTNRPVKERFNEHKSGKGSDWTSLHKPIRILGTKTWQVDAYDEDKYTKKYMDKYGIENVRGGSYVSVKLPDYQVRAIRQELYTSNDKCFKCGEIGHYANSCTKNRYRDDTEISDNIIINTDNVYSNVAISDNSREIKKENENINNYGAIWTKEEEIQLLKELREKKTFGEIAEIHKRGVGGIRARVNRIIKLGFEKGRNVDKIANTLCLDKSYVIKVTKAKQPSRLNERIERKDCNEHNTINKRKPTTGTTSLLQNSIKNFQFESDNESDD